MVSRQRVVMGPCIIGVFVVGICWLRLVRVFRIGVGLVRRRLFRCFGWRGICCVCVRRCSSLVRRRGLAFEAPDVLSGLVGVCFGSGGAVFGAEVMIANVSVFVSAVFIAVFAYLDS